jgi:hypothetical protein
VNDNLSIIIRAILEKGSKAQLENEIKNIEKNIKPLEIKTDVDKIKQQFKVLEDGSKELYKVITNSSNAIGQQVQTIAKVDQQTKQLVVDSENVVNNYKKQRLELEKINASQSKYWAQRRKETLDSLTSGKNTELNQLNQYLAGLEKETALESKQNALIREQIALYQRELAIKNQNLQTIYGKHYDSAGMGAILGSANALDANNFKTVDDLKKHTKDLNLQVAQTEANMKQLRREATLAMKEADNFSTTFIKDIGKLGIWAAAASAIYTPIRAFRNGVAYIYELDNALNEVRIVTGATQQEVESLANSYNDLAKEMSVTTRELAATSADLYRQGLNDSQVEDRMKAIVEYAKISSISLDDSTRIITATANATGESVEKIIDIFALLGDTTASGADEIGLALQRVASAAENSNISLEKSASWINCSPFIQ